MKQTGWWGELHRKSRLSAIWTDREVPLVSPIPLFARLLPRSYLLDDTRCTSEQLEAFALALAKEVDPEFPDVEHWLAFIKEGDFPIPASHFKQVSSIDPDARMAIAKELPCFLNI